MSWGDDAENTEGSYDVREKAIKSNRKVKQRFSVSLSDEDYEEVQKYCEALGIAPSVYTRTILLREVKFAGKKA